MPHSEYHKIYAKYEIDQNIPIEVALTQISVSGRGVELKRDLLTEIKWVNQFSWLSFRHAPPKDAPPRHTPPEVSSFRSY